MNTILLTITWFYWLFTGKALLKALEIPAGVNFYILINASIIEVFIIVTVAISYFFLQASRGLKQDTEELKRLRSRRQRIEQVTLELLNKDRSSSKEDKIEH